MPHQQKPLPPEASGYRGKRPLKPRFWFRFLIESLGTRRVNPLVSARMRDETLAQINGRENLPSSGPFILAVNHFSGRAAFDTVAAVLSAVSVTRQDALSTITIIVGQRRVIVASPFQRMMIALGRKIVDFVFRRWRAHVVRIPLKNPGPDLAGLRSWRERRQPVFVFPEGRAGVSFGSIRRGAGRWLAALDLPVIPVGVWWMQDIGWTVTFGAPLEWTHRADLLDVQLGLEMAALLPEALALHWRADLARWREAHESR